MDQVPGCRADGPLSTNLYLDEAGVRLALFGEFDLASVKNAEAALAAAIAIGKPLEVDLRGVTFLDSSGLAVLLRVSKGQGGARISFCGPATPAVARMLAITGVDQRLEIEEPCRVPADAG